MSQGFKEQGPLWLHPLGSISAKPSAFNSLVHLLWPHYQSFFPLPFSAPRAEKSIYILTILKGNLKISQRSEELSPKWVSDLPIATEFSHEQSLLRGEKPAGWDLMCLEPRLVARKEEKGFQRAVEGGLENQAREAFQSICLPLYLMGRAPRSQESHCALEL